MVLIEIEAQFTKKRSKRRDRDFSDFEKGGADKPPPPISKRVKQSQ
jgi:hypothetical protein